MNTMHIRKAFQERIRSVADSITRKELRPCQKRIAAKASEKCLAVVGAPAQYAKGPG